MKINNTQKITIFILFASLIISAAISLYYNSILSIDTFPMQWDLNGEPTWYAPRLYGLWAFPVIQILICSFLALPVLFMNGQQQTNANGLMLCIFVILSALSLSAIQLWHFHKVVQWAS